MHDEGGVLNKRSILVAILGCTLAVAGMTGYFIPVPAEVKPATRLLMENPGGRVVFTHKAHSTSDGAYGNIACADCHHDLKITPTAVQGNIQPKVRLCADCHVADGNEAFIKSHQERYRAEGGDAACVTCHHTRIQGFSKTWNHEDHHGYASDCANCHHPERYEFKPGKTMTIEPQKCSNCHTAKANPLTSTTLKDAAHPRCESCHSDLFASGVKGCAACHSQVPLTEDVARGTPDTNYSLCKNCHKPIPGNLDAFHNKCMGCHDTVKKGPGKAAPCAQCHAKG
jgi:hypothetical protein